MSFIEDCLPHGGQLFYMVMLSLIGGHVAFFVLNFEEFTEVPLEYCPQFLESEKNVEGREGIVDSNDYILNLNSIYIIVFMYLQGSKRANVDLKVMMYYFVF